MQDLSSGSLVFTDKQLFAALVGSADARADAIATLYESCGDRLLAYCRSLVPGDPAAAQDILQSTFVALCERAARGSLEYRGKPPIALLCGIAKNLALSHYRKLRRFPVSFSEIARDEEDQGQALVDPQDHAANAALDDMLFLIDLTRSLDHLAPRRAAIYLYRDVLDLPPEEVGLRLGVKRGAVDTLVSRARHDLREHLAVYRPSPGQGDA